MNIVMSIIHILRKPLILFHRHSLLFKIIMLAVMGYAIYYAYTNYFDTSKSISIKTETVRRGTLTSSITTSGQVSSTNNSPITTLSSGVVTNLFVKNGQMVKMGDKIAEIELDLPSKQRYTQSLAAYQSAKNAVENARSKELALQAAMFDKWDTFKELAENGTYTNSDNTPNYTNRALPEFHIPEKEWLAAESDYKNQAHVIAQAQSALSAAWYSLNESSPIVYAPISGTVSGLSLQVDSVISSSTTTSTTTTSKNQIAHVITQAPPTISINITEIDVARIKVGLPATVTLDAFPAKQFRGTVFSIDTVGTTSSGVTNYLTMITLDSPPNTILPNMSATASIILAQKKNVLIVPLGAITTKGRRSTVKVQKNGQIKTVTVVIGLESETEGEVISGLAEGDVIVTGNTTTTSGSTSSTTRSSSPFSPIFGGRR